MCLFCEGGQPEVLIVTDREREVNERISEIILTLHKNKQFVSPAVVETQLLHTFRVNQLRDLRINLTHLIPLNNLKNRVKAVNQYLQIFKQLCNICTLHDFRPKVEQFLETQNYDDLHMGPLEANPDVIQLFNYKRANADDPVPPVTTGDVVQSFMEFLERFKEARETLFDNFIIHLVTKYELQSIHDLGLFCRNFPYLLQVNYFLALLWDSRHFPFH